ncbi:MAG: tetratricopeptide repeat protein [Candidatus Auribacterota bacterium]
MNKKVWFSVGIFLLVVVSMHLGAKGAYTQVMIKRALEFDNSAVEEPDYTLYKKAIGLSAEKKYDDALAAITEGLEKYPDNSLFWNTKGNIFFRMSKFDDALAAYDKSLALAPDYALAWYNKGVIYNQLGKDDDALSAFDEALKQDRTFWRANLAKGMVYEKQEKYDRALEEYNIAAGYGQFNFLLKRKTIVLEKLNKLDDAVAVCEKIIEQDQFDYETITQLGYLLRRKINFDAAQARFEEALKIRPDYYPALHGMGITLFCKHNYEDALLYLERAIALFPDNGYTWIYLGRVHVGRGAYENALESFKKARMIGLEKLADACTALALVYLGKTDEAVSLSDSTVADDPDDAQVWYVRAQVLSVLQRDGVSSALKRAMALDDTLGEVSLTDPVFNQGKEETIPAEADAFPGLSDFTDVLSE